MDSSTNVPNLRAESRHEGARRRMIAVAFAVMAILGLLSALCPQPAKAEESSEGTVGVLMFESSELALEDQTTESRILESPAVASSNSASVKGELPRTGDTLKAALPAILAVAAAGIVILAHRKAHCAPRGSAGRDAGRTALSRAVNVRRFVNRLRLAQDSPCKAHQAALRSSGQGPQSQHAQQSACHLAEHGKDAHATPPNWRKKFLLCTLAACLTLCSMPLVPLEEASAIDQQTEETTASTEESAADIEEGAIVPLEATPLSASARSETTKIDRWYDTDLEIIGERRVGQTLTAKITLDPTFPDEVDPTVDWSYVKNDEKVYLGRGLTMKLPTASKGCRLIAELVDLSGIVTGFYILNMPAIQEALSMTGNASLSGDLSAGSTVKVVLSDVPEDVSPYVTWYAGDSQNATTTYLGSGTSLKLDDSVIGRYVTAVVKDANKLYQGSITAPSSSTVEGRAPATPTIESAVINSANKIEATCTVIGSATVPVDAVSIECKTSSGNWTEMNRVAVEAPSEQSSVTLTCDLPEGIAADGVILVRTVAHNDVGASNPSSERSVVAQLGITVPLSMVCTVDGLGAGCAEVQAIENTGTLPARIVRIETESSGVEAGSWTCAAKEAVLFQGNVGASQDVGDCPKISPGATLSLDWTAHGLRFTESLTAEPTPLGSITYVIAAA